MSVNQLIWQLTISISKCCILNIGRFYESNLKFVKYFINGNVLPEVESCRDLGVIVSRDLVPREHINSIVLKAQQRANIILRCFVSRNTSVLLRAYLPT